MDFRRKRSLKGAFGLPTKRLTKRELFLKFFSRKESWPFCQGFRAFPDAPIAQLAEQLTLNQ